MTLIQLALSFLLLTVALAANPARAQVNFSVGAPLGIKEDCTFQKQMFPKVAERMIGRDDSHLQWELVDLDQRTEADLDLSKVPLNAFEKATAQAFAEQIITQTDDRSIAMSAIFELPNQGPSFFLTKLQAAGDPVMQIDENGEPSFTQPGWVNRVVATRMHASEEDTRVRFFYFEAGLDCGFVLKALYTF